MILIDINFILLNSNGYLSLIWVNILIEMYICIVSINVKIYLYIYIENIINILSV